MYGEGEKEGSQESSEAEMLDLEYVECKNCWTQNLEGHDCACCLCDACNGWTGPSAQCVDCPALYSEDDEEPLEKGGDESSEAKMLDLQYGECKSCSTQSQILEGEEETRKCRKRPIMDSPHKAIKQKSSPPSQNPLILQDSSVAMSEDTHELSVECDMLNTFISPPNSVLLVRQIIQQLYGDAPPTNVAAVFIDQDVWPNEMRVWWPRHRSDAPYETEYLLEENRSISKCMRTHVNRLFGSSDPPTVVIESPHNNLYTIRIRGRGIEEGLAAMVYESIQHRSIGDGLDCSTLPTRCDPNSVSAVKTTLQSRTRFLLDTFSAMGLEPYQESYAVEFRGAWPAFSGRQECAHSSHVPMFSK